MNLRTLATGLRFPEGPIAMNDGSVILVEIARGALSRVAPNGNVEVIAELGGGPNGAAIGPDGKCYVCNNGGFKWIDRNGRLYPGEQPDDYRGGSIQRVDLDTGKFETLYTECDGHMLRGPNDVVFDRQGGFWFTDHGKTRPRDRDRTGVYYASADGNRIVEAIFPAEGPNGIGLSPTEHELYVAETMTARVWAYPITSPGNVGTERRLLQGMPGFYLYDSLAVDAAGNVCVATLINGGISVLSPTGGAPRFISLADPLTTNICFGGPNLTTAFATLSSVGELVALDWDGPGLPLNFLNR